MYILYTHVFCVIILKNYEQIFRLTDLKHTAFYFRIKCTFIVINYGDML